MTDPWPGLARRYGRKSCVSLAHQDAEIDAETARQAGVIFPLFQAEFDGAPARALDYGCGAGRFSPYLADAARCRVNAYDPCADLLRQAPSHPGTFYYASDQWRRMAPYDVVFTAMVLCLPHLDPVAVAADLVSVLAEDGALCVLDHMVDAEPEEGRWVHFRPFAFYRDLFAGLGVALRHIGTVAQFDNEVAITVGRRT